MKIFYTISATSGGHPEPTIFNWFFTGILGFIIGKEIVNIINKNK
ncbi:MAG: hypothetical protein QM535_17670 [Limnohabitans sp.]|nr:hypothetical protein [Limnohabitans sp.]